MELSQYKIEEINDLKSKVDRLEVNYDSIKEQINRLETVNNQNFDRIYSGIEKVQKALEGINHITLKQTMQEGAISQAEKDIASIQKEIEYMKKEHEKRCKELESEHEALEKDYIKHDERQKTALKTLHFVYMVIIALMGLGLAIFGRFKKDTDKRLIKTAQGGGVAKIQPQRL